MIENCYPGSSPDVSGPFWTYMPSLVVSSWHAAPDMVFALLANHSHHPEEPRHTYLAS